MSRVRLTETRIAAFSPSLEGGLRDTETHLRARPGRTKVYFFRSTLAYRDIKLAIGEVGAVALPDARATAKRWQGWVEEDRDPREATWLKDEAARRPTHAAPAFRLLRGFINWCASHPDYADQVHADAGVARAVRDEVPAKRAKDDCLRREQLRAAAIEGLTLHGLRRSFGTLSEWVEVPVGIVAQIQGPSQLPATPC